MINRRITESCQARVKSDIEGEGIDMQEVRQGTTYGLQNYMLFNRSQAKLVATGSHTIPLLYLYVNDVCKGIFLFPPFEIAPVQVWLYWCIMGGFLVILIQVVLIFHFVHCTLLGRGWADIFFSSPLLIFLISIKDQFLMV